MFEGNQNDLAAFADDLHLAVQNELAEGERVFWTGQPIPSRLARKALPLVLFGIPWTAFALFWMWGATGFGKGLDKDAGPFMLFPLFGLPFVLIGLGMLTSPYWAARQARKTVYAVTDRRVFILSPTFFGSTKTRSFQPEDLDSLERTQHADGSGDLVFTYDIRTTQNSTRRVPVGFLAVPNVKDAEQIVATLAELSDRHS